MTIRDIVDAGPRSVGAKAAHSETVGIPRDAVFKDMSELLNYTDIGRFLSHAEEKFRQEEKASGISASCMARDMLSRAFVPIYNHIAQDFFNQLALPLVMHTHGLDDTVAARRYIMAENRKKAIAEVQDVLKLLNVAQGGSGAAETFRDPEAFTDEAEMLTDQFIDDVCEFYPHMFRRLQQSRVEAGADIAR